SSSSSTADSSAVSNELRPMPSAYSGVARSNSTFFSTRCRNDRSVSSARAASVMYAISPGEVARRDYLSRQIVRATSDARADLYAATVDQGEFAVANFESL